MTPLDAVADAALPWIIRLAGLFWLIGAFALIRQIRMEMTLDRMTARIEEMARDFAQDDACAKTQAAREERRRRGCRTLARIATMPRGAAGSPDRPSCWRRRGIAMMLLHPFAAWMVALLVLGQGVYFIWREWTARRAPDAEAAAHARPTRGHGECRLGLAGRRHAGVDGGVPGAAGLVPCPVWFRLPCRNRSNFIDCAKPALSTSCDHALWLEMERSRTNRTGKGMRRIFALMLIATSGWLLYQTANTHLGGVSHLFSPQMTARLNDLKFVVPAAGALLGLLGGLTVFFNGPGGAALAMIGRAGGGGLHR